MRLHSLHVQGYKRLKNCHVQFGQATFLIGENNVGKSSLLKAIDLLLTTRIDKLTEHDYSMLFDQRRQENIRQASRVILTGEFRNVSPSILDFQGFNASRLLKYIPENQKESGLKIIYRKTFYLEQKPKFEILTYPKNRKSKFENCQTPADFIEKGIAKKHFQNLFHEANFDKRISQKEKILLDEIEEIWDIDLTTEKWEENPGGFHRNVTSKLPKYILIPAVDKADEITSKNGALIQIMNELFAEVREQSENYQKAQKYLEKLSQELDPQDTKSEFGKLMGELNQALGTVFPTSKIHTETDLSDPNKVLKPSFNIQMSSNIKSPVSHQGTGMIRTVVFSLLKFRETWTQRRKQTNKFQRSLMIGFEEPEIYLHPNAANQMRNMIYELVNSDTQIICSTHSPYMIDLSRKPRQILNNLTIQNQFVKITAFNISDEFLKLQAEDKTYIKMLQRIDDYVARIFFARKVYIVEGDTDEIVLKKTISLFPESQRKKALAEVQIIKAHGKASIISLLKYLNLMNISVFVIHDRDQGTRGAEVFNPPILRELGNDENKRLMLEECIEDELGYQVRKGNKPFQAYQFVDKWKTWDDIPENWQEKTRFIFAEYFR